MRIRQIPSGENREDPLEYVCRRYRRTAPETAGRFRQRAPKLNFAGLGLARIPCSSSRGCQNSKRPPNPSAFATRSCSSYWSIRRDTRRPFSMYAGREPRKCCRPRRKFRCCALSRWYHPGRYNRIPPYHLEGECPCRGRPGRGSRLDRQTPLCQCR